MDGAGIYEIVRALRTKGLAKARGKGRVVAWRETDYLRRPVEAGVIILPTRGCGWGLQAGCTMCGYVYDAAALEDGELLRQMDAALMSLRGVRYLKLFNSGSFFDPAEVPQGLMEGILQRVRGLGLERLQVESRPEFITPEAIGGAMDLLGTELEIGIGLETASDKIRAHCINKGFSLADFRKALGVCKDAEALVKAYLLIKPPFLTEEEAIRDAVSSGIAAWEMGVDRLSYNPVNVQRWTLVEHLWRRGEYRPPWLWSVLEVLEKVRGEVSIPVLSHPTAAGRKRGPHNCGACDGDVYKAIMELSINQRDVERPSCRCTEAWQLQRRIEGFLQSPLGEWV